MDFKLFSLLAIIVAISPTFVISKLFTNDDKIYLDDQWLVVKLEGSKSYGEKNGKLYGCRVERELNTDEKIQAKEARLKFEESMEQMTEDLNKDMAKMKRDNYRDMSKMKRDMAKMIKKMKQDAYRYKMKMQKDIAKMNRQLTRDMNKINRDIQRDLNRNKGRKNIKKNQRRAEVNQDTYEDVNYDTDEDMNPEMDQYRSPKKGRKNRKRNKNVYTKQGMVGNGIIRDNSGNVFNSNNVVNSDTDFNMDSSDSDMQNNASETIDQNLEGDMEGKKSRKNNKKNRKNNKKSRKNNKKNKRTANTKFVKTPNDMYDNNSGNNNVVTSIDDVNSNNDSNNFDNTVIVDTEQNTINTYQDMNTGDNSGNTVIADTDQNMSKTNQFVGQDSSKTYTDVDNTNEEIVNNTIIGDNMQNVVNNNNLDDSNNNDAGKVVENIVTTVDDVNSNNTGNNSVDPKQSMNPETDQNMAEIIDGDVEENSHSNKTGKSNKKKRGQINTKRVISKRGIYGNNKGNIVNDNNVVETINDVDNNKTGDAVIVDPDKNMATMNDGYILEDIDSKNSKTNIKKKGMAKKGRVITTNDNTGNNYNVNGNKDVYNDNFMATVR